MVRKGSTGSLVENVISKASVLPEFPAWKRRMFPSPPDCRQNLRPHVRRTMPKILLPPPPLL